MAKIPKTSRSELDNAAKIAGLLQYINSTPEMLSLLYDLDLMPEQVDRESHDWYRMLTLATWHRTKNFSK